MLQCEKQAGAKERVRWKTAPSKGERWADGQERGVKEDKDEGEMSQVETGWRQAPDITVVSLPVSKLILEPAIHHSRVRNSCVTTGVNDTDIKEVALLWFAVPKCWRELASVYCFISNTSCISSMATATAAVKDKCSCDSFGIVTVLQIFYFFSPFLLTRTFAGHSAWSGPARSAGLHGITGVLPPRAVHTADWKTAHTAMLPHTG